MTENAPAARKVRALTNSSMAITPTPGADIARVSEDAQRIADMLGINIEFAFNGVKCIAVPGGSCAALAERQQSEQRRTSAPYFKRASSRVDSDQKDGLA